jgi:FKBP-type peptidyl-prolyl cis-trans isomerase FklB
MKRIIVLSLLLGLLSTVVYAEEIFKTQNEKLGYAIGMNIGINMKRQNVTADADQLAAGLKAAFQGVDTLIDEEEMGKILMAYQQEMQMKQAAEMDAAAAANIKLAEEFMASNGKQEGVVTLDSGLQYKVLTSGDGATPNADSKVEVHYRGTLIDGTEFDSSYTRGEPASFPVNGVIAGWTEALQLMKVGDKWQLAIPPQLAYGERGAPPVIPANAALVFEVELLKILQ